MQPIDKADIQRRIQRDNPWWAGSARSIPEANYPRRVYFASFCSLALNYSIKRATVLLGPRRVGKTVMIKQLIQQAIEGGVDPSSVLYVSIDSPIYSGISLERFLEFLPENGNQRRLVVFDEIQYLKDWEVHLKDLVDSYPETKFIASGSAAAALRLKSKESGAGRFSDYMLPPLTFYEFLTFIGEDEDLIRVAGDTYEATDIARLNLRFIDYLNYGGYPEAVLNEAIRADPEQFIRNDIIDKVLLKDLPSLYGIDEIQELNKLFSFLAYNAGNEASLENISSESGLAKPTIKKYIAYLESAFLIIKLTTVDDNCRTMKRERNFKVYLNNPSMRAALFAPVDATDGVRIGHLTECAIFSQWQHSSHSRNLRYARWRNEGEVDIVSLSSPDERPMWVGEIKWSDRVKTKPLHETKGLAHFIRKHPKIMSASFTTKTISGSLTIDDHRMVLRPSSLYCYTVGRNVTKSLEEMVTAAGKYLEEKEINLDLTSDETEEQS